MKKSDIRVLLVDDETHLIEAMRKLLELEGYQVATAPGGREALRLVKASPFDIVFLDVNMPELNGLETYRQLKEIAPAASVVMITGYGRSLRHLIEEARELGVKACIDKPFRIQQVIDTVRSLVPHES
jgi:CheY-like chemotaxis protein